MKKQSLFHARNHKPYWGVLAPDSEKKIFHKPDNLIGLIQANDQPARIAPDSATQPRVKGKGSGKNNSIHVSKDTPL